MSKIKNGALDQYGTEPFEQQQFGPAGAEGVNVSQNMGIYRAAVLAGVMPLPAIAVWRPRAAFRLSTF